LAQQESERRVGQSAFFVFKMLIGCRAQVALLVEQAEAKKRELEQVQLSTALL
jgi:hypothetical protein